MHLVEISSFAWQFHQLNSCISLALKYICAYSIIPFFLILVRINDLFFRFFSEDYESTATVEEVPVPMKEW